MTAAQLQKVIATIYPTVTASGPSTYTVTVDSTGNATITLWNNALGVEPTTAQLTAGLTAMQLTAAQQSQILLLEEGYEAVTYTPVSYMGTTFPCTANAIALMQGVLLQGSTPQGLPTGFSWYNSENQPVAMTLAQVQGLANLFFANVNTAYNQLQTLSAQVMAATTVTAVQAITWPTTSTTA